MATGSDSTPIVRYFDDYQSYHQDAANERTHWIGIPLIVLAIGGLLSRVSLGPAWGGGAFGFDAGLLLWLVAASFYIWLDFRLGASFSVMLLGMYVLGRQLMVSDFWWVLWVFFIGGWILQLVGHYRYEKKSPAFLKNIEHLLVGPFWIFAKAVGYYRLRRA